MTGVNAVVDRGTSATLVRDAVIKIGRARVEPHELFYEIASRVRRVVPYDAAGWLTLDPDSMLTGGTLETNKPPALVRAIWHNELLDPDVNKLRQLARRRVPVASLSELDAASAVASRRAQVIPPGAGIGDELRALLRAGGVVVLDTDGHVTGKTDEAMHIMALMPGDATATLYALAIVARQRDGARTRVRLTDGRWVVLDAARMTGTGEASDQIAVTLIAPSQLELASLLLRLHGLSTRERQVAELLMRQLTADEIAPALCISRFTVGDHVKAIYAKAGVSSRVELLTLGGGRTPK